MVPVGRFLPAFLIRPRLRSATFPPGEGFGLQQGGDIAFRLGHGEVVTGNVADGGELFAFVGEFQQRSCVALG